MYIYYNPNPLERKDTGDCAIRAVAKALNTDSRRRRCNSDSNRDYSERKCRSRKRSNIYATGG